MLRHERLGARLIRTIHAVVSQASSSVPRYLCQVLHDREFLLIAAKRLRLAAFGFGSELAVLAVTAVPTGFSIRASRMGLPA